VTKQCCNEKHLYGSKATIVNLAFVQGRICFNEKALVIYKFMKNTERFDSALYALH
jgi:hypothetical protein